MGFYTVPDHPVIRDCERYGYPLDYYRDDDDEFEYGEDYDDEVEYEQEEQD